MSLGCDWARLCNSNRIDSVRDLFCRYPPTTGKYVLILDEIQAMSKAGAQSLLKILEEPPNYGFIFCTTEIKNSGYYNIEMCKIWSIKN